jgi:glycosyltransferase involved in cell wall biosynthesis
MPNVVMEAMASGVPVVASDIEEITGDLIQNDQEGVVVSNGRADDFAKRVVCLLNNPGKRERIGKTARKKMSESFSSSQLAERFLKIL